ncbi:MAG TPA: serine/threonine-protein kinase [Acidimicrobiales bacterium]|nr:serine/threonine-protein kinase [Acidimicrobiales bacterium]
MPELPGYEFLEPLGRGASGTVYRANQLALGRTVAIKHMRMAVRTRGNEALVKRFRREARTMAHLEHPNIVRVLDFYSNDPDFYLVEEYVDGPTLRDVQDRLSHANALHVISQLAAALAFAHHKGVAHRDLKPENVLLAPSGDSKLTDFGIAKIFSGTAYGGRFTEVRTQAGNILGTVAYMSPEAAAGKGDVDHRTDLYALGVISYELLVRRLPFLPGSHFYTTLLAYASEPVPRPTSFVTGFPLEVEAVLLKALEKEPDRRQRDVGAFWGELRAAASAGWPGWEREVDLSTLGRSGTGGDNGAEQGRGRSPGRDNRTVAAGAVLPPPPPPGSRHGDARPASRPLPDHRPTVRPTPPEQPGDL